MRYVKLPKTVSDKSFPTPGSMFLIIDQEASLAMVSSCETAGGHEYEESRVKYTVLCNGYRSSMSLSDWRKRVHVEQAENLIIREVN